MSQAEADSIASVFNSANVDTALIAQEVKRTQSQQKVNVHIPSQSADTSESALHILNTSSPDLEYSMVWQTLQADGFSFISVDYCNGTLYAFHMGPSANPSSNITLLILLPPNLTNAFFGLLYISDTELHFLVGTGDGVGYELVGTIFITVAVNPVQKRQLSGPSSTLIIANAPLVPLAPQSQETSASDPIVLNNQPFITSDPIVLLNSPSGSGITSVSNIGGAAAPENAVQVGGGTGTSQGVSRPGSGGVNNQGSGGVNAPGGNGGTPTQGSEFGIANPILGAGGGGRANAGTAGNGRSGGLSRNHPVSQVGENGIIMVGTGKETTDASESNIHGSPSSNVQGSNSVSNNGVGLSGGESGADSVSGARNGNLVNAASGINNGISLSGGASSLVSGARSGNSGNAASGINNGIGSAGATAGNAAQTGPSFTGGASLSAGGASPPKIGVTSVGGPAVSNPPAPNANQKTTTSMPIVIKQEDFTETDTHVFVSVPLNGVRSDKADIYANDSYIKINFAPFFYEADLADKVDTEESEAVIGDGCVKFTLKKIDPCLWGALKPNGSSAESIKARRAEAFQRELERVEKYKKDKAIKKREEHYKLIQEQLNVERAEKAKFEAARLEEQRLAEDGIQKWKESLGMQRANETTKLEITSPTETAETARTDSAIFDANDDIYFVQAVVELTQACDEPSFHDESDDDDELDMDAIRAKVRKQMDKMRDSTPQPRGSGTINFKFTSRGLIPTSTARESEDVKWVHRINQAFENDAKSRSGQLQDPLSVDEKNREFQSFSANSHAEIQFCLAGPAIFLKDKGNSFFKTGNFESAVNAFTAALRLDAGMLPCLTNRAICHLKLENFPACIKDCTEALDRLTTDHEALSDRDPAAGITALPTLNANKVKVLVRRAAALAKMNRAAFAVKDYEAAVVLDPKNEDLKLDLETLKTMK
ncbi:hypothetical protein BC830DRAFT_1169924 [Chytriomyces sp. MP71]|nr:hypothetical protein BC830DRAFT_1169924 [Chytriomyces sp. MP71]